LYTHVSSAKLRTVGEVEQPLSLSLHELGELPQSSVEATLECDYSSGPPFLVANAVWIGVSLTDLIELAVPKPTATMITFVALDGYRRGPFSADGATVANFAPLPGGSPQGEVTGYDIYLGTDACTVEAAGYKSQEYLDFVAKNNFALNQVLEPDTVSYWRVDQIGYKCAATGRVWSFTTADDPSAPTQ
jgi:hypothetical protein